MSKPLPQRKLAVRTDRTGPPRLDATERKALETVEDENLRRVLGEILRHSEGTQENFETIEGWFPIQPRDSVAPAYEGGGVEGLPFRRVAGGLFDSGGNLVSGPGGVTIEHKAKGTYWATWDDPEFEPDGVSVLVMGPITAGWSTLNSERLVLRFYDSEGADYDLSTGGLSVFFMAFEVGEPGDTIVGPEGPPGPTHKTLYHGEGEPAEGLGEVDDFYIDITVWEIYGPKTEEGWGKGVSLIGPAGSAGEDGKEGPPGEDGKAGKAGKTILHGEGEPTGEVGLVGDFYIDTNIWWIYGPKE